MSEDPRNRCEACGRIICVEFHAPDDLWRAAAGKDYADYMLCLSCFDSRVPDDWPVMWESVTTLWPISCKRALADAPAKEASRADE